MRVPELTTERLILRLPCASEAPRLAELLNDRRISDTTLAIPFPYTLADAEAWIDLVRGNHESGESINFSILLRQTGELMGGIGLRGFDTTHKRAELGFWIGAAYWNNGYMTEAVRCVIDFGFDALGLHRIWAGHLLGNDASGRVQQKAGMTREGVLRDQFYKNGRWIDDVVYSILRHEWEENRHGDGC